MNRMLALLCAWTAAAALAQDAAPREAIIVNVALEPKKIHEECLRVEAGETRAYHWKASSPVDFNVHYHRGKEVFFPVKRDAMRGDGGTFTAKSGEDFCWMWTARDKPAKIDGRISQK